jgi:16S rRNA U1498 N3-methylase RsmE
MLQEDNRFVLNYQKPITAQHTEKPPHTVMVQRLIAGKKTKAIVKKKLSLGQQRASCLSPRPRALPGKWQ